ncbi:glyceraldehyde-3-phosphate dehydrogenase 1 [Clavispora lusitaniae]|nr:glyceraldehyde-3-phosphate dehydrogenase 1 [Clavispora lusitaniae]
MDNTKTKSYVEGYSESYETEAHSRWQNFKDSFKRVSMEEEDEDMFRSMTDIEKANLLTSKSPLQRKLKSRNITMIAIGSSIGSALFVGSGAALNTGGPAGILIAWTITGLAIFTTMQSLGELSVAFPVSGGFNLYATRFIDSSVGFAVAWNYFIQFLVLLPLELVSSSITMQFWNNSVNPDVWVLIFYIFVCSINMFGVRAYGETEFLFSAIKVVAVVMFIIVSIVLAAGGGPNNKYVGSEYWHNPGAFANGFKGCASVFVTAAFAYAGVELVGLAAAESENPRRALPRAIKQVFWRILMFYLVSLTLICFLVPYNDDRLLGASSVDVNASPFVIAIESGGIKGLPHVMNAVILVSVISVASTCVYATSRTLTSLAEQGLAPKICAYVDRAGRPLVAIGISNLFALLAFIAASGKQAEVFSWLMSISALSSIASWISINWAHIRFRRGLKAQGRGTDELTFVAQTGTLGSYFGCIVFALVLVAQFWIALFPIGGSPNAEDFFMTYLGAVILIVFYVAHKVWKRNWILQIPAKDLDIDTGRREPDLELLREQIRQEKAILRSKPWYSRFYHLWC